MAPGGMHRAGTSAAPRTRSPAVFRQNPPLSSRYSQLPPRSVASPPRSAHVGGSTSPFLDGNLPPLPPLPPAARRPWAGGRSPPRGAHPPPPPPPPPSRRCARGRARSSAASPAARIPPPPPPPTPPPTPPPPPPPTPDPTQDPNPHPNHTKTHNPTPTPHPPPHTTPPTQHPPRHHHPPPVLAVSGTPNPPRGVSVSPPPAPTAVIRHHGCTSRRPRRRALSAGSHGARVAGEVCTASSGALPPAPSLGAGLPARGGITDHWPPPPLPPLLGLSR